jgi:hypothetical protein
MKRGLISWDQKILPPAEFESRLASLQAVMDSSGVAALVAYTDVGRSNDVRFISNYMPYWNRALTVIPRGEKPILLCSLSPRVYPWIKSVTVHETVIPSPSLPVQLAKLCAERGWRKIGVCDFSRWPAELHDAIKSASVELVDIPRGTFRPQATQSEIAMHGVAARLAREVLEKEISNAAGKSGGASLSDHGLTGRLERGLRRAGAEDLIILVSNGKTPPVPATGQPVNEHTSVVVALEYNGHWAKVSRNLAGERAPLPPPKGASAWLESLSGAYPWEALEDSEPSLAAVVSLQVELGKNGKRLYYGDTYLRQGQKLSVL